MEEFDLPFASPHAPDPNVAAERIAREAARLAAEVDRRLAREQPGDVVLPPRGQRSTPAREPATAGTIRLPYHSPIQDPANITGARNRAFREFRQRPLACVSCGYRKLETRIEPAAAGLEPAQIIRPELHAHVGTGERKYLNCSSCYDVSGNVPHTIFKRWLDATPKEDVQITFRHDPRFPEIADRLAEIDARASMYREVPDLGADLPNPVEAETLAFLAPARREDEEQGYAREEESEFDGIEVEERVPVLSDFTGAIRAPDGYLVGTPDPEFARGAAYDPSVVRADEVEAWLLDRSWDADRKEYFRAAWERAGELENPQLRHQRRAFIAQRWDPRSVLLAGEGSRVAVTNFLAPAPAKLKTPSSRSGAHSGLDEDFAGEPGWKRESLARHEAMVAKFLTEVKPKLKARGLTSDEVEGLTRLPDLEPRRLPRRIGREITRLWGPLRDRLERAPNLVVDTGLLPREVTDGQREPSFAERLAALRRMERPTFLAPKLEIDRIAVEGTETQAAAAQRREVAENVEKVLTTEPPPPSPYAPSIETGKFVEAPMRFREMAERARQREAFDVNIQAADAERETARKWADEINRATMTLRAATNSFADEIRGAFRDPVAFQQAFRQLNDDEKRQALALLRERPETFSREFASRFNREFGKAGELLGDGAAGEQTRVVVAARSFFVRPPSDVERAGVLAAGAGERYLDAVGSRDVVRKHAATALDLPADTPLKDVRAACESMLGSAMQRKAAAIQGRDGFPAPSPEELSAAFGALHPKERKAMMKADPTLAKLMPERRREVARPGLSL